jgi:hypothetical protein
MPRGLFLRNETAVVFVELPGLLSPLSISDISGRQFAIGVHLARLVPGRFESGCVKVKDFE